MHAVYRDNRHPPDTKIEEIEAFKEFQDKHAISQVILVH